MPSLTWTDTTLELAFLGTIYLSSLTPTLGIIELLILKWSPAKIFPFNSLFFQWFCVCHHGNKW